MSNRIVSLSPPPPPPRLGRDNASRFGIYDACTHARSRHRIIPLGAATGRDTNVDASCVNCARTGRRGLNVGEARGGYVRNVIGPVKAATLTIHALCDDYTQSRHL